MVQAMQVAAQFSIGNPLVNQEAFLNKMYHGLFGKFMSDDDIEGMLTTTQPVMGPDGQPLDPALTQGNAAMTPGAQQFIQGGEGTPQSGGSSFSKRTQSGKQGGGGADSQSNNIKRTRASQPSTTLNASSRPR